MHQIIINSNLENLGTAILALQRINNTQIKQILQAYPELVKILTKSPQLLSFEDGLWLQCQTCEKFYQALGSENLQPPCCINS